MPDEMMNLRSLVEKTPDADMLLEMIAIAATRDLLVRKLDAGAKARLVDKAVADMARRLN